MKRNEKRKSCGVEAEKATGRRVCPERAKGRKETRNGAKRLCGKILRIGKARQRQKGLEKVGPIKKRAPFAAKPE